MKMTVKYFFRKNHWPKILKELSNKFVIKLENNAFMSKKKTLLRDYIKHYKRYKKVLRNGMHIVFHKENYPSFYSVQIPWQWNKNAN